VYEGRNENKMNWAYLSHTQLSSMKQKHDLSFNTSEQISWKRMNSPSLKLIIRNWVEYFPCGSQMESKWPKQKYMKVWGILKTHPRNATSKVPHPTPPTCRLFL